MTGVGGLMLDEVNFKLPETVGPVASATLLVGFVILGIEKWRKGSLGSSQLTWSIAIACGVRSSWQRCFPGRRVLARPS